MWKKSPFSRKPNPSVWEICFDRSYFFLLFFFSHDFTSMDVRNSSVAYPYTESSPSLDKMDFDLVLFFNVKGLVAGCRKMNDLVG